MPLATVDTFRFTKDYKHPLLPVRHSRSGRCDARATRKAIL